MSIPPPIPPQPIAYATPVQPLPNQSGYWARGPQLITTTHCVLPERCVKCGQASTRKLKRKFSWHEPWLYLTILAGVLIYAIIAIVLQKRAELHIGLCETHYRERTRRLLAAWGIVLLGIAVLVLAIMAISHSFGAEYEEIGLIGIPVSILLVIIGTVYGAIRVPVLRPTKIDDQYAYFKGAGAAFLGQLDQA